MLKYENITFSEGEDYKYRLLSPLQFQTKHNWGVWKLINPNNKQIVAKCDGQIIYVYKGYMWDGCTIIGNFYEDDNTLLCSLLHDILYNVKKNHNNINVDFSLWYVDYVFYQMLKQTTNKSFFSYLYLLGLWSVGIPWKIGSNKFYELVID